MQNHTPGMEDMASFLLIGVFLRGIILPIVAKFLAKIIKELLVKTKREMDLWHHYHEKGRYGSKK